MREPPSLRSHRALEAHDLVVGHGGRALLPPLSFAMAPGERWLVVGRNGAGKSTLIKTLLGLLPAVGGRLQRPGDARMAYVAQAHQRDPHAPMRASDLVAEGLDHGWSFLRPWRTRAERARVGVALERAGAGALLRRRYGELSEGQKQRVLLARAVVAEPDLVVLDEPTSALDLPSQREALALLRQVQADSPMAVLLVSHHLAEAIAFCDHAIYVDAHHGVAWAGTTAELVHVPRFRLDFGPAVGRREEDHDG